MAPYLGNTYTLKDCPAYDFASRSDTKISGEYEVVEFCPYEPSAYVNSPYFLVIVPGTQDIGAEDGYGVDEWDLIEQIDPPAYQKMLEYERLLGAIEDDPFPSIPVDFGTGLLGR